MRALPTRARRGPQVLYRCRSYASWTWRRRPAAPTRSPSGWRGHARAHRLRRPVTGEAEPGHGPDDLAAVEVARVLPR
ncbi:hypothetical protein ACRAWF_22215 [Streptomyces sp. L7]